MAAYHEPDATTDVVQPEREPEEGKQPETQPGLLRQATIEHRAEHMYGLGKTDNLQHANESHDLGKLEDPPGFQRMLLPTLILRLFRDNDQPIGADEKSVQEKPRANVAPSAGTDGGYQLPVVVEADEK